MKDKNPACPCGSGAKYGACCRRYHRGDEPADALTLMRSRFSAFALGDAPYLWRTLDPEHPDRARPEAEVLAELRAAFRRYKYVRLEILDHRDDQVTFRAEVYESGKDRSFTERSTFKLREGRWRYHSGAAA